MSDQPHAMATILVSCDGCGGNHLTLKASDVRVRICADDKTAFYVFSCPACGTHMSRSAGPQLVDVMTSSGCRLEVWNWPDELFQEHSGPPINWDDVLDFHYLLASDDWQDKRAKT